MNRVNDALEYFGGVILAIGLMLIGLSGWKYGTTALSRHLSDHMADPVLLSWAGFGLTFTGAAMCFAGRRHTFTTPPKYAVIREDGANGEMLVMSEQQSRESVPAKGTQRRVCLTPAWPQRETPYWVGGLPKLPADVPWPMINGHPACFLAQIGLSELPATLWQGLGPRHGALVFFGDGNADVTVLHVEGSLVERAQPDWTAYNWASDDLPRALQSMIGEKAKVPPRWYLDLTDEPLLGSVEDMEKNDAYWDNAKGDWIWEAEKSLHRPEILKGLRNGANWDTPFAILAGLRVVLEDRGRYMTYVIEHQATTPPDRVAKAEAGLETIARSQKKILALETTLHDIAKTTAYDPTFGAELQSFFAQVEAELRSGAGESLARFDWLLPEIIEGLARYAYCEDPESVPAELFERLAPLWEEECATTRVFLGTDGDMKSGDDLWLRLIDLPSNPLTGITIGDLSRFYADIPAEDFATGNLTTTYGANTHGTH